MSTRGERPGEGGWTRTGPRVVVRRARVGEGLFAGRVFAPGRDIIHIRGRIVHHTTVWTRGGTFADNCFRYGPETYLDPGDDVGRYVNHGCVPNAGIRKRNNRLFLFAAAHIAAGREILIDYSTILGDDDIWTMRCRCGAARCRKRITRFGLLPRRVRDEYIARGLIPRYVLATLDEQP